MFRRRSALLLLPLMASAAALAAIPTASADDAEVNQRVKDSLVYERITFVGQVRVPGSFSDDGRPTMSDPAEVTFTCSGFAVDAEHIATAGHCVAIDAMVVQELRFTALADLASARGMSEDDAIAMIDRAFDERWPVEGAEEGAPIERSVSVIQPTDPDRVIDDWTSAELVDFQQFDKGDNALLRVSGLAPLPALVLAEETPPPGNRVTSVGFPGSVRQVVDAERVQQPSFKSGTISSQQVSPGGAPTTEINADMSGGMSGGPTVEAETGHVLGVNSYGITDETETFNFITDTKTLRTFLQRNGVDLDSPPALAAAAPEDESFPWAWVFASVCAVALLVAGALFFLGAKAGAKRKGPRKKRRIRRKPAALPPGTSAGASPAATTVVVDAPPESPAS